MPHFGLLLSGANKVALEMSIFILISVYPRPLLATVAINIESLSREACFPDVLPLSGARCEAYSSQHILPTCCGPPGYGWEAGCSRSALCSGERGSLWEAPCLCIYLLPSSVGLKQRGLWAHKQILK